MSHRVMPSWQGDMVYIHSTLQTVCSHDTCVVYMVYPWFHGHIFTYRSDMHCSCPSFSVIHDDDNCSTYDVPPVSRGTLVVLVWLLFPWHPALEPSEVDVVQPSIAAVLADQCATHQHVCKFAYSHNPSLEIQPPSASLEALQIWVHPGDMHPGLCANPANVCFTNSPKWTTHSTQ